MSKWAATRATCLWFFERMLHRKPKEKNPRSGGWNSPKIEDIHRFEVHVRRSIFHTCGPGKNYPSHISLSQKACSSLLQTLLKVQVNTLPNGRMGNPVSEVCMLYSIFTLIIHIDRYMDHAKISHFVWSIWYSPPWLTHGQSRHSSSAAQSWCHRWYGKPCH